MSINSSTALVKGQHAIIPWDNLAARNKRINNVKTASNECLTVSCLGTKVALFVAAEKKYPSVALPVKIGVINACVNQVQNRISRVAHTLIESNACYGNENSCISRTTSDIC